MTTAKIGQIFRDLPATTGGGSNPDGLDCRMGAVEPIDGGDTNPGGPGRRSGTDGLGVALNDAGNATPSLVVATVAEGVATLFTGWRSGPTNSGN